MIIAVVILAWLLVNTWLSLIFAQFKRTFFSGWNDLAWLFVYAVINPFLAVLIGKIVYLVIKRIKKSKKKNTQKIDHSEDFE